MPVALIASKSIVTALAAEVKAVARSSVDSRLVRVFFMDSGFGFSILARFKDLSKITSIGWENRGTSFTAILRISLK